jgi:diaminopimelate epimerase
MKTVPFWKMSGSGNDFVVIDNRRRPLKKDWPAMARRLCDRHFGVGADGLLLMENVTASPGLRPPSPFGRGKGEAAFRMVYYNADGSRAKMCGNGARCMAYFARAHGVGRRMRFLTEAYPVEAHVDGNVVRVKLADPRNYRARVLARVNGRAYQPAFIDTGVPHAVLFVREADRVDVEGLGRALRFHRAFGSRGANVNFVQKIGPHQIRVRTYERGVEAETLACGTGVTASAVAAVLRRVAAPPVRCGVKGGDMLKVNFKLNRESSGRPVTDLTLRGPVQVTFKGEFYV